MRCQSGVRLHSAGNNSRHVFFNNRGDNLPRRSTARPLISTITQRHSPPPRQKKASRRRLSRGRWCFNRHGHRDATPTMAQLQRNAAEADDHHCPGAEFRDGRDRYRGAQEIGKGSIGITYDSQSWLGMVRRH